jgi:Lrp/AsnC family leucine-responsive transcriptional regulator
MKINNRTITRKVTKMQTLDNIDKSILEILQFEGRISVVDLAKRVGLSKTPCLTRLRRLEKTNYIEGYQARINPGKVNQGYLVYVQVKLENTTSRALKTFNEAVRVIPDIMSCHMLSGGYDYLLKVRTKDMVSYRDLLGDVIASLPGVLQISSFPVMEEVKDSAVIKILKA